MWGILIQKKVVALCSSLWYSVGMDRFLQLRMRSEDLARLSVLAKAQGNRSVASLVREIVEKWLSIEGIDKGRGE
jgi:hypothetical protein